MNGEEQCPFCKIASGQIPAMKVFEDDISIAILDIKPANPGHTLMISKKHYMFLQQMQPEEIAKMFNSIKFLSVAIMQSLGATGVNILYNLGPGAGQKVGHVHVHLIPRYENDGLMISEWEPKQLDEQVMNENFNKIIEFLSGKTLAQVPAQTPAQPPAQAPQPAAPPAPAEKPKEEPKEEKEEEKKPVVRKRVP